MEYAVIMSGGVGSRFWPKSRKNMPKQFLRTVGAKTMIQTTVDRISNVIPMDRIYIVTNEQYINTLETQIPVIFSENILIEPTNRDTPTFSSGVFLLLCGSHLDIRYRREPLEQ
ncbi:MAG: sugar phosphate nucleotidyltransferase [Bacillota bacterium]